MFPEVIENTFYKMITNRDILEIFQKHIPSGTPISVYSILEIVEKNYPLDEHDHTPNDAEIRRGQTYPRWKRKVQAALHKLKIDGLIQHNELRKEYIF